MKIRKSRTKIIVWIGIAGVLAGASIFGIQRQQQYKTNNFYTTQTGETLFFTKAKNNSSQNNEAFVRANNTLNARMTKIKPNYLFPKKIKDHMFPRTKETDLWNNKDVAADLYGFLVLGAYYTNTGYLPTLQKTLDKEISLSENELPSNINLDDTTKTKESDDAILFGASEYVKDGLIPLAEDIGESVRYDRMINIEDAIFAKKQVKTKYGYIPSKGTEVNGDHLETLPRLYLKTRNQKYLEWAESIADNYIYDILPANQYEPCEERNFETQKCETTRVRLRDHGNEIIPGLVEVYNILVITKSPKQKAYKDAIEKMLDQLLKYTNQDQLFQVSNTEKEITDNWGYIYNAYYLFYMLEKKQIYLEKVQTALSNLNKYSNYKRGNDSMDGLADTIEGALYLLNTMTDTKDIDKFIDYSTQKMFAYQGGDGFVDATYLDGNFIRTSLMYGLYKSKGIYSETFDTNIGIGAHVNDNKIYVYIDNPKGKHITLKFDTTRHKTFMGMPYNYPRINAFPERYTIDKNKTYKVSFIDTDRIGQYSGEELLKGLLVDNKIQQRLMIEPTKTQ